MMGRPMMAVHVVRGMEGMNGACPWGRRESRFWRYAVAESRVLWSPTLNPEEIEPNDLKLGFFGGRVWGWPGGKGL